MTEYQWQSRFYLRSMLQTAYGRKNYERMCCAPQRSDYDTWWEYDQQMKRWREFGAPILVHEYPPMPQNADTAVISEPDDGDFEPCQRPGFLDLA
jgi:hypothetical protein